MKAIRRNILAWLRHKQNFQKDLAREMDVSTQRMSQLVADHPDAVVVYHGKYIDRIEYTIPRVLYSKHHHAGKT